MRTIERSACAITGAIDLEPLYTFKDFPVFMGCTGRPESEDLKADMTWVISKSSGLIQLKSLLPLDVLYPEAHGAGCVGGLWNKHHKAFASFLKQFSPTAVLEIGGSHGILENEYRNASTGIPWTIIEPNPTPIEGSCAKFIKGFFDDHFIFDEPYDAVIHSHVFEHIYEPDVFMKHISGFMRQGKYLIFSVPNMNVMLERKYTNCINFEHTIYNTEPYIEYLLAKHGFNIAKKQYFLDDHSIFYAAVRDAAMLPINLPVGLYEINKMLYQDYVYYHESLIAELNSKMRTANQQVYLFGAHVFAQYLIAFGLNADLITCLLDNDKNKHKRRLYGTSLFVDSPKVLADVPNPVVILKAGVYNNEIKQDILTNINPNTEFWE